MKLINVRVTSEDAQALAELQQDGISVSDVVREAIRSKAKSRRLKQSDRPTAQIIKEIFARNPEPEEDCGVILKSKDPAAMSDVMRAMVQADHRRIVNDNLARHKRAARPRTVGRPAARKGNKASGRGQAK